MNKVLGRVVLRGTDVGIPGLLVTVHVYGCGFWVGLLGLLAGGPATDRLFSRLTR